MKFFIILSLIANTYCVVFAQTGPGGVGNSTTNVLWLSADNGVYNDAGTTLASNGNNVEQWNDRSGNGKNASQNTAGNRPNYVTGALNSLPVIRFTAANTDRMLSTGVTTANSASVWVVASYSTLPSDNPGLIHAAPSGQSFGAPATKSLGIWVDGAPDSGPAGTQVWGRGIQSNGTTRDISQATVLSASTTYIISNIYGGSINQYVNGAAAGNNASHNGTLQDWSDFGVGSQGTEGWNGDIAEVIAYNASLNTAQRIIVDNYLSAKYGLTLASSDIFQYDATFGNEVAGIGQATDGTNHIDAQGTGIVRIIRGTPNTLADNEFLLWGHNGQEAVATITTALPAGVDARFARVWRVSERNQSGGGTANVGNISIRFDLTGLGPITASDLRLLIDTDGDGSFNDGGGNTVISGAALVSGNVYEFANVAGNTITDGDQFTLGTANSTQTPLPVDLLFFDARANVEQIELIWSTSSEANNDHFTIERTKDGLAFEVVDEVPGAGNSQERKDYELIDSNPFQGKSYYRLSQTDYDGTTKYFPMVSVDVAPSQFDFKLYPNPTDGEFDIELEYASDGVATGLSVSDLQGREIFSFPSLSTNDKVKTTFHVIPPVGLLPGVYVAKLAHGQRLFMRKLVVE